MSAGVLLLAHGTPDALQDMPAYLKLVRGGRVPSQALVAEIAHNYAAIGGRSPLTDITMAQARALGEELGCPVYVGMRNWHPFIGSALARAEAEGMRRLVAIPLAPQYSSLSVAKYRDAVEDGRPEGLAIEHVDAWFEHPLLLDAFAEKLALTLLEPWDAVLFTAHSLPLRVVAAGDPYPEHVHATAAGVAARTDLGPPRIAYQSAGRTGEPWLGPTIDEALDELAKEGVRRVVVAPIGFVSDHTEILYDIDIAAAEAARVRGLELRRTASLNTAPLFIRALADLARPRLG
jgi:protoporphyrin/coproporphyrin ferrochelatase